MRLLLLTALLSANAGGQIASPVSIDDAVRLECVAGTGSGFRVSGDRYISAEHVTASGCTLAGHPMRVIYIAPGMDFTVISTTRGETAEFEIDCEGFKRGRTYLGLGWALGRSPVAMPLTATGSRYRGPDFDGLHVLNGRSYPGQSGGPVIDAETRRVVGIVNAGDGRMTLSRQFKDTALCR